MPCLPALLCGALALAAAPADPPAAKNAILFVGDGMGVSTVSAARVFSVGVDGQLTLDTLPFTALSRTWSSDYITPDSAGTMSAMITGAKTSSGIISLSADTERGDFLQDGDGEVLPTLFELAIAAGKRTGVVTTARVTHATPAACYAHVNERGKEAAIALQALPDQPAYNDALGPGLDVLMGGGRRFFVPRGTDDEEGSEGRRDDGLDLRAAFVDQGYRYVWNADQLAASGPDDRPLLGLFESSHMEYEHDRPQDLGGEPSLTEMALKALELLEGAEQGYLLMVEGGRIDHAHHGGNAYRALRETEQFDRALAAVLERVDLEDTLVLATADHSHVFAFGGYPLRPLDELPYAPVSHPEGFAEHDDHHGLLNTAHHLTGAGQVVESVDTTGQPYTPLLYANGPGYRGTTRANPWEDDFPGITGRAVPGPTHPDYRQEAAVPLGSETHGGEDVALYAIGPGASAVRGTLPNTAVFDVLRAALGL